ncbi:MAG: hypothetical protein LC113_02135 [Acidobacteria bacterium]|nr:hypothetical protein [Acidobacteriota bacterium]
MKFNLSFLRPFAICAAAFLFAAAAFAQGTAGKTASFDLTLQLIGSGGGTNPTGSLPEGWDKASKALRPFFADKKFGTIGTFQVRSASGGSVSYEGVWARPDLQIPAVKFSLQRISFEDGRLGSKQLSFTMIVPAKVNVAQPELGRREQYVRVDLNDLSIEPNSPTVIASIDIGGESGPVFVVLTAKPAQD